MWPWEEEERKNAESTATDTFFSFLEEEQSDDVERDSKVVAESVKRPIRSVELPKLDEQDISSEIKKNTESGLNIVVNTNPIRGVVTEDVKSLHTQYLDRDAEKIEYYKKSPVERSVPNVLDTEETRSIVISKSGQTLSEFLTAKRSRRGRTIPETSKELAERLSPGEKFNPYNNREKRKLIPNKPRNTVTEFMDGKVKKSHYEKSILKSLGISSGELAELVAPESSLSDSEKARLLSVGYFGMEEKVAKQNGKSRFITLGDLEALYYLDKFLLATSKNIGLATGRGVRGAQGYMKKLQRMGLVQNLIIMGMAGVWALTNTGRNVIGSVSRPIQKKHYAPSALSERLFVNHIAGCLWNNNVNILNLEDFPYTGREFRGKLVRGEELIPESDIMSAVSSKISELRGGPFVKDRYKGEGMKLLLEYIEIAWRKWEQDKSTESPELLNPLFYVLMSDNPLTNKYLLPDLIVKRPRMSDGSPGSIAVEVERSAKSVDDYVKKLMVYQADKRVYSKVIYVTPLALIADRVEEAANRIGFDRFDVVPLLDEEGNVTTELSSWLI